MQCEVQNSSCACTVVVDLGGWEMLRKESYCRYFNSNVENIH